jgi:hypothetical protein
MLHTFDHCARELTAERARRVDAGQSVAKDEIEVLIGVAGAIRRSVGDWGRRLTSIDLDRPFDRRRAEALIVETVFDDVLTADALTVLGTAIALTDAPP